MRRTVIITLVALFAVAGISAGVAAAGPKAAAPPTKTVAIKAGCSTLYCFKPAPLTVKRGTKVVWKNTSGAPHTVTRCSMAACHMNGGTGKQTGLRSGTIGNGKTYSFTFRQPGTYRYYCMVHGYATMHGTITVR
jgi:plastocyanin